MACGGAEGWDGGRARCRSRGDAQWVAVLASATVTCEAAAGWRWSLLFLRRFNKITKRWDDAEPIHWHLLYPVFRTRQSGSVQVGVLASPGLRRCDGTSTACQARGANEGLGHGVKVSVGGGQWSPRCCWSSLALWTVAAVAQRRQQYGVRGRQFHGAEKKWLATWMVSLPPLTLLGARKLKHLGRGSRSVSTLTDDVGSPSFTKQLGDPPWRPTTRCLLQPDGKEGSSSRQSPWKKGAPGRSLKGSLFCLFCLECSVLFPRSMPGPVVGSPSAMHTLRGPRQLDSCTKGEQTRRGGVSWRRQRCPHYSRDGSKQHQVETPMRGDVVWPAAQENGTTGRRAPMLLLAVSGVFCPSTLTYLP